MKKDKLTLSEIEQWVDNDEGLYLQWKLSRLPKREFIKENRQEIENAIVAYLNRSPARTRYY